MGLGVHGLLLCEGMRDELGVTPPDQGVGGGAGQATPGCSLQKRLNLDPKGAAQPGMMILDGLDGFDGLSGVEICGACCDNDGTHRTPPARTWWAPRGAPARLLWLGGMKSLLHFAP